MAIVRRALVTGAARRVGRAIVLALADAGCDVAIHYRVSRDDAESLAEQVSSLGRRACLVSGDLADASAPKRIVDAAVNKLGGLDVLVNSAARFGRMSLEHYDDTEWHRELQVNLAAAARLCHHAVPHMQSAGGGSIVNITDIAADRPFSGHLAYCTSKAGLSGLTKALARELAPAIRVNGVAPGIAVFPDEYDEETRQRLVARVPLRRAGTPEDVAAAVCFLVVEATYMTGQIINVDGGRSIA